MVMKTTSLRELPEISQESTHAMFTDLTYYNLPQVVTSVDSSSGPRTPSKPLTTFSETTEPRESKRVDTFLTEVA